MHYDVIFPTDMEWIIGETYFPTHNTIMIGVEIENIGFLHGYSQLWKWKSLYLFGRKQ